MKKTVAVLALSLFLAALPCCPVNASSGFENAEMNTAQYWINKVSSPDDIIMNKAEIEQFNTENSVTMNDIENYSEFISDEKLKKLIPAVPDYENTNYYVNGKKADKSFYDSIEKNIGLNEITSKNKVRLGVTVNNVNAKAYPVEAVVTDSDGDLFYDQFQVCEIYYNEPVAILKQSHDKKWYYVSARHCSGWVKASDVALYKTRTQLVNDVNNDDFLIVTGDKVSLDENPYSVTSDMTFRMGTKLPLAKEGEYSKYVDNRYVMYNYVLKLPVRGIRGYVDYKYSLLPVSADVSEGYLPYTARNVLELCFKRLGDVYGWGGMYNSQDCSGYVKYVYSCFGFNFSRNSAAIANMPLKITDLTSMTADEKKSAMDNVLPGSLLYFRGHIAVYIGSDDNQYYTISAVGSLVPEGETAVIDPVTVIINSVEVRRANKKTWAENFEKLIEVAPAVSAQ